MDKPSCFTFQNNLEIEHSKYPFQKHIHLASPALLILNIYPTLFNTKYGNFQTLSLCAHLLHYLSFIELIIYSKTQEST